MKKLQTTEEMFHSEATTNRINNANKLVEVGISPFVHGSENISFKNTSKEIKKDFDSVQNGEKAEENVSIAGRVVLNRCMGNLIFMSVQDEQGTIQIKVLKKHIGEDIFKSIKTIDLGDIIKVEGNPCRTDKGELSIDATNVIILTKALAPLPDKFAGLTDIETKYRKPYINMIVNTDVKDTFIAKSKIISLIRRSLEDNGSIEVETPVLNSIPGGANAKPFITHHNALGVDRYLRIAPELYLKRVIIGGINKVFELGKNFRNEGIDATHNPEFTSVEFYWAYIDYKELMNYITILIQTLALKTNDTLQISYGEHIIDFNNFKEITFRNCLTEIGGVPADILDDENAIIQYLKQNNIQTKFSSKGKLWEELFDEFVEEKLIDPTFITEYPTEISPLARRNDTDPTITERFELFIAGREIANGFNELNDPIDQHQRFKSQVEAKDADDESMHMDQEFIEALMIGLPPVAGAGIGIDRLVMLLTNKHTIKDVIIFPAMKN